MTTPTNSSTPGPLLTDHVDVLGDRHLDLY